MQTGSWFVNPVAVNSNQLHTQFLGRASPVLLLATGGDAVSRLLGRGSSCSSAVNLEHLLQHQGPLLQHTQIRFMMIYQM